MKKGMFCIYDNKAEAYAQPFFFNKVGEAIRAFTQLAQDGSSQVGKHPEDFCLFHVADYDEISGEVTPLSPIKSIGYAVQFKGD
jgi:hypothetical protein